MKVVGNGDVLGRPVPFNGCVKCVGANDDHQGNNNTTDAVTVMSSDCKIDKSDCSVATNDGKYDDRSQVLICNDTSINNKSCYHDDDAHDSCTSAPNVAAKQSETAAIEELNSDLSNLAVTSAYTRLSEVPSDQSASEALKACIQYIVYESERQMEDIMRLITKDLSEPYSIYTYRYFIHNWPRLCFLVCFFTV